MPDVRFDRFYRYAELTAILKAFAAEYPGLVDIESIGKSHEGRDVWLLTVTNHATGPQQTSRRSGSRVTSTQLKSRPPSRIASISQSSCAMHGKDPEVTRAVDTRAFYVCPRVNPADREWALADSRNSSSRARALTP
jgi:hypothetical protein